MIRQQSLLYSPTVRLGLCRASHRTVYKRRCATVHAACRGRGLHPCICVRRFLGSVHASSVLPRRIAGHGSCGTVDHKWQASRLPVAVRYTYCLQTGRGRALMRCIAVRSAIPDNCCLSSASARSAWKDSQPVVADGLQDDCLQHAKSMPRWMQGYMKFAGIREPTSAVVTVPCSRPLPQCGMCTCRSADPVVYSNFCATSSIFRFVLVHESSCLL